MELNDLEILLQKYYDGKTSEEEEKKLKHYFNQGENLYPHLKSDAALFQAFTLQQEMSQGKFLADDWLLEKVRVHESSRSRIRSLPIRKKWLVAASIILIAGMVLIGRLHNRTPGNEPNHQLADQGLELQEMKSILLANNSPSERIRVISRQFDPKNDEQVIDILVRTLNKDANVNVRLAAGEALYRFLKNRKARREFINSLENQTDPMIQIFLVEILSTIKDKDSLEEIRKFNSKTNLHPAVKEKTTRALSSTNQI